MYLPLPCLVRTTIDVPASHGDALAIRFYRGAVVVDDDRRRQARPGRSLRDASRAQHNRSTCRLPCAASRRFAPLSDDVDLLVGILLHIGAEERLVAAHIEGASPRVAQPERPDLGQRIALADERIVCRDQVGLVDIEAQHLAEQRSLVLAVACRHVVADAPVVGVAAVTGRDVEHAVRPEADPVTVVIELRPVELRDDALHGSVGLVGIRLRHLELGHDVGVRPPQTAIELAAAKRCRVGKVELAVLPVVRVERDAEQPALIEEVVLGHHLRPDVDEWIGQQASPVVDDAHLAVLLDHSHAAGAIRDRNHRQRMDKTAGDFLKLDFDLSESWSGHG